MEHGDDPTTPGAGDPAAPAEGQYLSRRERRLAEQRSREAAEAGTPDAGETVAGDAIAPETPVDDFDPFAEVGFDTGPAPEVAPVGTAEPEPDRDAIAEEAPVPAAEPVPVAEPEPAAARQPDPREAVEHPAATEPEEGPSTPPDTAPAPAAGSGSLIDYSAVARPERSEWIPLILGVVVPPVGVITSIAAALRSRARRGFAIRLNKAALVVSLVMCVVAGGIVVAVLEHLEEERLFEEKAAAAVEFCAAITEDPRTLEPPIIDWPRQGETIPATIEEMRSFVERWDQFAMLAPVDIADGVGSIADRGRELLGSVEQARQIDDEQQVGLMRQTVRSSGLLAWADRYCAAGED